MSEAWLPPLVLLSDSGGNWQKYLELLYHYFEAGFIRSKPSWPGKRVGVKRRPEEQGKAATFWHFISEGSVETDRLPDLRRCERIRWPKPVMESFDNAQPETDIRIVWWKSQRGTNESYVLAVADFSYVVIVADRGDYVLPWTAYCVEKTHRQNKLRKEYENYWKTQKS